MSKKYAIHQIPDLLENGDEQSKSIIQAEISDVVNDIARVIGNRKAFLLVEKMGGVEFAVPKGETVAKTNNNRSEREQRLIDLLGADTAKQFMQAFGGSRLYIPNCRNVLTALNHKSMAEVIRATVSDYCSAKEASEKYCTEFGVSDRQVRTILKKQGVKPTMFRYVDERQMDLFSE